jgi:hypothetical protein
LSFLRGTTRRTSSNPATTPNILGANLGKFCTSCRIVASRNRPHNNLLTCAAQINTTNKGEQMATIDDLRKYQAELKAKFGTDTNVVAKRKDAKK